MAVSTFTCQECHYLYQVLVQVSANADTWSVHLILTSYCALLEFMELALDEAEHQAGLPNG